MSKPLKIFGEVIIHPKAVNQMYNAMDHESVIKGALMPDAHVGYSLPIGGVVQTKDFIFPAWVGYDIGCGMCAVPTSYKKSNIIEHKHSIFQGIYDTIPVGFKHHKYEQSWVKEGYIPVPTIETARMFKDHDGLKQLGTLGGGNHFIEIGYDESDRIWITVHSGSRNVGHKIATHYMKLASPDGRAREGNYGFDILSDNGAMYYNDMNFALHFALANRKKIVVQVCNLIDTMISGGPEWEELINRNHNHAKLNASTGYIVHRKGAIHAEKDMLGVIPSNMRDGVYIVKGKGNPDSISSSSHGAGRIGSRRQAKEAIELDDFKVMMKDIVANVTESTKDESPVAYKEILDVLGFQDECIEVINHIKPIINIKA